MCVRRHPSRQRPAQLDVRLESEEADAALAILNKRVRGEVPATADWKRLFASDGYVHLKEREAGMGRAFTDSAFTAFLMSDTLLHRATLLDVALPPLEHLDVSAAAGRALKSLPAGTKIRARLYLEIKPITNSFVFTGRDSTPSIFLYLNPHESPAQLENTVAHELHHIGLNSACPEPPLSHATPAQRKLLRFLGAFGEGQAMLAAAGSRCSTRIRRHRRAVSLLRVCARRQRHECRFGGAAGIQVFWRARPVVHSRLAHGVDY